MKLKKQQIIDYVNAGFEIEMENPEYRGVQIKTLYFYDGVFVVMFKGVLRGEDIRIDTIIPGVLCGWNLKSINQRPFTPLPNGTMVSSQRGMIVIEGEILSFGEGNYEVEIDKNNTWFIPFHKVTPIIEEEEEEEEDILRNDIDFLKLIVQQNEKKIKSLLNTNHNNYV